MKYIAVIINGILFLIWFVLVLIYKLNNDILNMTYYVFLSIVSLLGCIAAYFKEKLNKN